MVLSWGSVCGVRGRGTFRRGSRAVAGSASSKQCEYAKSTVTASTLTICCMLMVKAPRRQYFSKYPRNRVYRRRLRRCANTQIRMIRPILLVSIAMLREQ